MEGAGMIWSGKLLFGLFATAIGGPYAGLFAAGMAHTFDREVEGFGRTLRRQQSEAWRQHWSDTLFAAEFLLAGHLAARGGMPSGAAEACFDALAGQHLATGSDRDRAWALFDEGQRKNFPLTPFVNQVRRDIHRRRDLVDNLLLHLVYFCSFDQVPTAQLRRTLYDIAHRFGLSERDLGFLEHVAATYRQQGSGAGSRTTLDLPAAYATLGVSESATKEEVRRAYRVQISRHHPDKLMHTGPSAEQLARAAARADRIRKAYDSINRSRGW
jgi:DnaJ like chaperone protein